MDKIKSKLLISSLKSAYKILRNKSGTREFAETARQKAIANLDMVEEVANDINALIRMVKAWSEGSYRRLTFKTVSLATAALVYFVNPFDMVPDMLPFLGFVDDAAVIGFVIAAIRKELNRFRMWEGVG